MRRAHPGMGQVELTDSHCVDAQAQGTLYLHLHLPVPGTQETSRAFACALRFQPHHRGSRGLLAYSIDESERVKSVIRGHKC